jgi:hypothetical protein
MNKPLIRIIYYESISKYIRPIIIIKNRQTNVLL